MSKNLFDWYILEEYSDVLVFETEDSQHKVNATTLLVDSQTVSGEDVGTGNNK